jgi:hypothetical protein
MRDTFVAAPRKRRASAQLADMAPRANVPTGVGIGRWIKERALQRRNGAIGRTFAQTRDPAQRVLGGTAKGSSRSRLERTG